MGRRPVAVRDQGQVPPEIWWVRQPWWERPLRDAPTFLWLWVALHPTQTEERGLLQGPALGWVPFPTSMWCASSFPHLRRSSSSGFCPKVHATSRMGHRPLSVEMPETGAPNAGPWAIPGQRDAGLALGELTALTHTRTHVGWPTWDRRPHFHP